jgi:hypothetical protein
MNEFSKSNIEYFAKLEKEIWVDFPEFKDLIRMRYFGKNTNLPLLSAEGQLTDQNFFYKSTKYYYKENDSSFLHFTSLKSLLSILSNQSIRLRTLNGMNDVNEINYAAKLFGIAGKQLEFLQKEIFSFSLIQYTSTDKEIVNNTNNLDLWRFYGLNGDGVAIKFKLLNNPDNWESFHMSQIYYGEVGIERLKQLQERIDKFNTNNPKIYIHLPNIFSFHKSNHFRNEDEVRLIYSTFFDFMTNTHQIPYSISDKTKLSLPDLPEKIKDSENYSITIPLFKKNNSALENRFFAFAPKLIVEGVILGYKFKDDELMLYQNIINSVLKNSNGIEIDPTKIYITELKDIFRY